MSAMPRTAVLVLTLAAGAGAARAEGTAAPPGAQDLGTGFRLEGKPAVDDVFGDASEYRRTIDRFLELVQSMQAMRDDFARSVQQTLAELQKAADKRARKCPESGVAGPYARANRLGAEYLRIGRELTRHYDQVKEFDRLGDKRARKCPESGVAGPYARANRLGAEYLRIGRELTRHYDQVKEFDRLGE